MSESTTPASMGGPLSEAERLAEIKARVAAAKPRPETNWRKPLLASGEMRRHAEADVVFLLAELDRASARVGVLEGQLATAQAEVVIRDGAIVGRDKAINSLESWRRNWKPLVDAHMQAAAAYREYAAAMNIDRVWDELPTYEQCAWRAVVRAVSTPLTNDITWLISEIGYDHWDSCQFDDDTDGDYCTLCDGYSDLRDKYETKRTRS